jgi:tartrate-resistant acid phosphatase type 5
MHAHTHMCVAALVWGLQLAHAVIAVENVHVLSVGDWGSAALGGYHLKNAQNTATAMQLYLKQYNPSLVLNTGDNFYYCGIQNGSDAQINEDFVALFGSINVPWHNILGNHDYGFNPDAQLWLNQTIPGWVMDGRYYHRRVVLRNAPSLVLNVIALDTNPCVADYRGNDRAKWDPCGLQYPTCEPVPDECRFHENIVQQNCSAQLAWFRTTLDSIDTDREWVFVLGHHKATEINVDNFLEVLGDARVHVYLNGHTHNLEHYSVNEDPKYMTTGAGGMVVMGGHIHMPTMNPTNRSRSIWSKVVTGFTSHTFVGAHTVVTDFWDTHQRILHSFTTQHP